MYTYNVQCNWRKEPVGEEVFSGQGVQIVCPVRSWKVFDGHREQSPSML